MNSENFRIYEKIGGKRVSRPAKLKEGLEIKYGKSFGSFFFWCIQGFIIMIFFMAISDKNLEGGWILAICILLGFFNNFVRPYKTNYKSKK